MTRHSVAALSLTSASTIALVLGWTPLASANEGEMRAGGALDEPFVVAQLQERPGTSEPLPKKELPPPNPNRYEPPSAGAFPQDFIPLTDRWRIVENVGVNERWFDPYNQNTLKADRPIFGTNDWFIAINAISDTVFEPRSTPTPVAIQSGEAGVFGDTDQTLFAQTFLFGAALIKGDTAFKPQDLEFRLTFAYQYNYVETDEKRFISTDPRDGTSRSDDQFSIAEAFVDYHIRNVSERYDFDSLRVGIQPFSSDFRGFLFQANEPGIRLFGNRDNNLWQYNVAYFRRIDRDVNSGLPDLSEDLRKDDVFVANLYRQDFPILGLTSQATVLHNRNRDSDAIDANGFPARPAEIGFSNEREYDVTYAGLNMDGRIGRFNLTTSAYYAFGENKDSILSNEETDIRAFFLAAEPSIDFDWARIRLSALYASGDDDPYDGTDEGFDAVFENPQFAGADTSYWIRQQVPFIGGGFVGLSGRNAVLPSLRHSKEQGQSNFTNPGITLLGGGVDFDLAPSTRLSFNANYLRFNDTSSLEALRLQGEIDEEIGWDLSSALIYRPFFQQNVVFRLSGAVLLAGQGTDDLYGSERGDDYFYSVLANLTLTY